MVGFALEDQDLQQRAEEKLHEKHLNLVIANHTSSIGADVAAIDIKAPDEPWQTFPSAPKTTQAARIIRAIESCFSS